MGAQLQAGAADTSLATASLTTAIQLAANAASVVSAAAQILTATASVVLTNPLYTGVGGLLDSNFWHQSNVPAVGDTIYYDPTYITVQSDGEIVAVNNNCTSVCFFDDGSGLAVGLIAITPGPVAYLYDTTSAAANLSTAIQLNAAAQSTVSAVAALKTSIKIAAAAADVSTASTVLTAQIRLAGAALDTTSSTGVVPGGSAQMSANALTTTNASAVLTAQISLGGACSDVTTAIGSLVTQVMLHANAGNVTSALATLVGSPSTFFAAALDSTSATASLTAFTLLAASAQDLTMSSASMQTQINLMANAVTSITSDPEVTTNRLPVGPVTLFFTGQQPFAIEPDPYQEVYQAVGSIRNYAFDWTGTLANRWAAGFVFAANFAIRPTLTNGYQYVCTTSGETGNLEPQWPASLGTTVIDGSCVWTCEAVDATSLGGLVNSALWTLTEPMGLTGFTVNGNETIVTLDTTECLSGIDYDANVLVTLQGTSAQQYVGKLRVKVR